MVYSGTTNSLPIASSYRMRTFSPFCVASLLTTVVVLIFISPMDEGQMKLICWMSIFFRQPSQMGQSGVPNK